MGFLLFRNTSPRVEDEVNLCFLTDIFLFPAFFIFAHVFSLDTFNSYVLFCTVITQKYTLGLAAPKAH
jgi:hypothetical protein